jgi:serine/threonine protein kinase
MPQPNVAVLPVGSRFMERYEIVRCMKAGGMGAVYEVVDQKTRRRRALKIMLPESVNDADLRARFKLEATITADVESDHIVETFDADINSETGSPFLVMELLKGEDLSAMLQKRGRLPADEVVLLLGQVALALDKTHAAGIVHRDLKPENLFLTRTDEGSPRVKVLDFGIAKVMAQSAGSAMTTRVMGTPVYMPREQIVGDGAIGPPADLYALGHIAFTLLVGEPYWSEEARTAPAQYVFLTKVLQGAPEPASARAACRGVTLPVAFDAWFAKTTALEPAFRFDRASIMIAELAGALGVAASRVSPHERGGVPHASPPAVSAGVRRDSEPSQPTRRSGPPATEGAAPIEPDQKMGVPVVSPVSGPDGPGTTAGVSNDRAVPPQPARSKRLLLVGGFVLAAVGGGAAFALRFTSAWPVAPVPNPSGTALAEVPLSAGAQPTPSTASAARPSESGTSASAPVPAPPDVPPSTLIKGAPTGSAKEAPPLPGTAAGKAQVPPRRPTDPPLAAPSSVSRPVVNQANDDPTHIR